MAERKGSASRITQVHDSEEGENALTDRFPAANLTVLAHFYRGELQRSNVWRQKMDMTTNWAVVTTTALISVTFTNPASTHLILPIGSILIYLLLNVEGRRYRFFDVWRTRVRMLEVHLMVPALYSDRRLIEGNWREVLCNDLLVPSYKISYWEAIGRRLYRNYLWLFSLLLGSWVAKVIMYRQEMWGREVGIYEAFGINGMVPPWLVLGGAALFHLFLLGVLLGTWKLRRATGEIRRRDPNRKVWPI
ncbi:MAG: DUF2270 domain-containing protein [Planctomycetota bacterium]